MNCYTQQEGELIVVLKNLMGPQEKQLPKKTPKRDNGLGQESLMSPSKNKGKGPIALIGGFGVWPDSRERG